MTLRLRLVASLGALLTVGLMVFGLGTYRSYARSQWSSFDEQLRSSLPVVTRALTNPSADGSIPSGPGDPQLVLPPGTYAELRDATQAVTYRLQLSETVSLPDLPATLAEDRSAFTVGSHDGSGSWRVLVSRPPVPQPGASAGDRLVVIAVPTGPVERVLQRLIVIETGAGAALLLVLSAGSWLILRRGLRPLESMATSARAISAGNVAHRVEPSDARSEIGQLGLALNSMLDRIEVAFAERDATEQKLRRFLSDASHELRTPLTSIQGFAELFRLGMVEHGQGAGDRLGGEGPLIDQRLVMARIEGETARMRRLVEDLLTLARLDEVRPFAPEAVDLAILAADACTDALALDPTRPLELDAPQPVVVDGHKDHLRQAVANLMANAVRHTPAGTPVEVSVGWSDGWAELAVRDHGPGLDPEALAHVFDRFWQADPSRRGEGVGLGLSIVAGIAHEHHGTVEAANHAGGGAVFTLRLPAPAVAPR